MKKILYITIVVIVTIILFFIWQGKQNKDSGNFGRYLVSYNSSSCSNLVSNKDLFNKCITRLQDEIVSDPNNIKIVYSFNTSSTLDVWATPKGAEILKSNPLVSGVSKQIPGAPN